ncbi:hypothetical protein MKS88_001489 [Plasmodium brasilianum]|uniref:Uncharacterized protein n=1 Tax=Plasmodium brasilianum TaxID=5824 RepID=A0ACB9YE65_PLABR|nr:hypothetical protein MKS88_001489 [Plasmodium brasilianum]
MKAPSFKPIYDVIRIKKKERSPDLDTELYKEFINVRKKVHTELENKNVKIIIYEHIDYEGKENLNSSGNSNNSSYSGDESKASKKNESKGENKTDKREMRKNEDDKGRKEKIEEKQKDKKAKDINKEKDKEKINEGDNGRGMGQYKSKGGITNKLHLKEDTTEYNRNDDIHKIIEKKEVNIINYSDVNINENLEKKKNKLNYHNDMISEKKSKKIIGTVKILYNFYVNLFNKIKEDVENIKNNTTNNNVDLFKDMNLYTNYISMFDIINICEDLKIIKTFLNSKKECELIWILTVNYFDKINENIFERYKYKIDVTYKDNKTEQGDVGNLDEGKNKRMEFQDEKEHEQGEEKRQGDQNLVKKESHSYTQQAARKQDEEAKKKKTKKNGNVNGNENRNENGNEKEKGENIDGENTLKKEFNLNEKLSKKKATRNRKSSNSSNSSDNNLDKPTRKKHYIYTLEENQNIKEYIYEKCYEKKNAIMFRKVNFFIFVYILIYIIKTSTRKIKAISDDIKKVRSFFFFLNLYEKKKTIETLKNIYKDKYLNFYQNFKGSSDIEEHRKRKIFRHKFSFYNINKILNNKDDLVRLKNTGNKKNDNSCFSYNSEVKNIYDEKNINQNETLTFEDTSIEQVPTKEHSEEVHNKRDDLCNYQVTNFIEMSDLANEFNIVNKSGDENKKEKVLLNQYIFDYIFKNYCYKKKYWGLREGTYIDFIIIKNENKKYKIDIYNHSKYNIHVDVNIDNDLPVQAIFKDKLFCISSKYTIYLQIDKTEIGEKLGFINVTMKYKNISKEDDVIRIPIYIFINQ